jgi:co-chaperonin GroES (HSP10)
MISPTGNHLIVEGRRKLQTAGGIHLLDDRVYSGETQEFVVLAVGPGKRLKNGQVKPIYPEIQQGDIVITPAFCTKEFELMGHTVKLLNADDALLRLRPDEKDSLDKTGETE